MKTYSFRLTESEHNALSELLVRLREESPAPVRATHMTLGTAWTRDGRGYPVLKPEFANRVADYGVEHLFERDREKPGRPMKFTLDEARNIKQSFWSGVSTIAYLARSWRVSPSVIHNLVYGHTYWYVETGF